MKEATGEANMTIVTVVLIAAVVAVATPIIINVVNAMKQKTNCTNRGCYWVDGACYQKPDKTGGTCDTTDKTY